MFGVCVCGRGRHLAPPAWGILEGHLPTSDRPLRFTPASLGHLDSGRATLGEHRRRTLPLLLMDPVTNRLERPLGAWDLQAEAGP